MTATDHRSTTELDACLEDITAAPSDTGTLELIVQRPAETERRTTRLGALDVEVGLAGDNWLVRGSRHTEDGSAEPDRQLTLMNARAIRAIAGDADRWAPAGDQLYVDLDLSEANLPAGTRLRIGDAEIEVSAAPHRGCAKFRRRFGPDAARWVNDETGRALNLRGINAVVVTGGPIGVGDPVTVVSRPDVADGG